MMRMRKQTAAATVPASPTRSGSGSDNEWEMRPGGMLVQKRDPDAEERRVPPPTIRVRVKYGSVYHEVNISSQASFGELKKMLSGPTGLHHEDQKLFYKKKERDSKTFLDAVGVKNKSKLVLEEDPVSLEKRYLEMRKTATMEKASKSISEISLDVDRLAGQVSALDSVINKGGKVAEKTLLNLIETLMNQLLKLDGIVAEGDVKLQRKMQVKRVQKYVEILDELKVKNAMASSNGNKILVEEQSREGGSGNPIPVQEQSSSSIKGNQILMQEPSKGSSTLQQQSTTRSNWNPIPVQQQPKAGSNGNRLPVQELPKASSNWNQIPVQQPPQMQRNQEPINYNGHTSTPVQSYQSRRSVGYSPLSVSQSQPNQQPSRNSTEAVVVTTQWETFDPMPTPVPAPFSASGTNKPPQPKFDWDLL